MSDADKLRLRVTAFADQLDAIRRDEVSTIDDAAIDAMLQKAAEVARDAVYRGDTQMYGLMGFAIDGLLHERRKRRSRNDTH